jgi:multidrug efflux system outer membrane protein
MSGSLMNAPLNRNPNRALARSWTLGFGLFLSACAVGPNYHPPKTSVPSAFANASQPSLTTNAAVSAWWRGFNDSKLNELIDLALATNQDLRIATANLLEARALHREAQFDLLPVIGANASYTSVRFSEAALFGNVANGRNQTLYDAGFDATWELDFFGHVRRSVQAAAAEVQAGVAQYQDIQVSLISELARTYFELRGTQNELAVARRNANNQRETVNITQARLDGGRGTELDVARARAQLNSTLASIPPLEAAIARSIHRLGVLTGQQPEALLPELEPPAPIPALPPLVAVSDPEMLLRRRSDVRAAERQLAAATARIGVEVADLFPRVTFNGRVAVQAETFAGLSQSGADSWAFGPRISWAALDLGHDRARIQAADARSQASLAFYEKVVLLSLEETENALVEFGREQARRDFLSESAQASQTAATLAQERFDNGATDFLTVLDAERVMLEAQVQLAQSQTRTATALVAVYKALGGGWDRETQQAPP